jgi:hypothetical protein
MNNTGEFLFAKDVSMRPDDRAEGYTLVFGANEVLEAAEFFGFLRALFSPELAPALLILRDLRSE